MVRLFNSTSISTSAFSSIFFLAVILLTACGGGGGGSNSTPTGTSTVGVSGTVTFTSYKPNSTIGLDYGTPTEKPIRGAIVELQNAGGTVLDSANTTATGIYSLTAPANSSVVVVVKAALGSPAAPNTKVVDNTNGGALYAMSMNVTTSTNNVSQDFNANSGWDGAVYSTTRVAAPFAILDILYQAQQMVLAADSSASFPLLLVNWSINNISSSGDLTLGQIGTSHYNSDSGQLYILGAAENDTDEYDTHVIAHEWGHYFAANFSRSDSIGGSHGVGDILDPTIAFGEGFGNAFSGMVMDDPLYVDTGGISQGTVYVNLDLEADSILDTDTHAVGILLDGFYAETSIQEVLYDLYDSGGLDDDTIGLGFSPIYNVLIDGQRTTPAFTSIFSFLHYLKQNIPASSAAITSLALAENIGDGDEYEATTFPLYTTVPMDGTVVTLDVDNVSIQTWTTFGPITANFFGNKLYNTLYFKFIAPAAGCYTFEATPTAGGDLILIGQNGATLNQYPAGVAETASDTFTLGEQDVIAVGSIGGAQTFTVRLFSTPSAC